MQNQHHGGETAQAGECAGAGLVIPIRDIIKPSGLYIARYYEDGHLVWEDEIVNLITTAGKNNMLDNHLAGSAYTAAWFMGLVDGAATPTYAAADTMASHAGWTENVGYSQGTRPALSWNSAAAGSKALSAPASFSTNASGTIAGAFVASNSAKSGATGVLYSVGAFTGGNQPVSNNGTLTVSYTSTLT